MYKVRASSTSGYFDCIKRSFARGSIIKLDKKSFGIHSHPHQTVGAAVGTACHTPIGELNQGNHSELSDLYEIGIESYRGEIKDGVIWDGTTTNTNVAEQQIQQIVRAYKTFVFPDLKPIAVEHRYTAKRGNILVSGQPDCIEPDVLSDLKTSAKLGQYIAQQGIYSIVARLNKVVEKFKAIRIDHIPRVGKNKPAAMPVQKFYNVQFAEKHAMFVVDRIAEDIERFEKSGKDPDVLPANLDSMLCGPKFCPAFGSDFCEASKEK